MMNKKYIGAIMAWMTISLAGYLFPVGVWWDRFVVFTFGAMLCLMLADWLKKREL